MRSARVVQLRRWILLLILLCGASRVYAASMKDMVPSRMDGWKSDGTGGTYDRKTLYSYIDGGAEVYLAYDFRQVFARRFVKQGQPAITVDLFDMGIAQDAYGVFTFEREGASVGIGQDSEYGGGFLRFWKNRYFVSILADRETPACRKAVLDLGRAVAASIKDDGVRPRLLSLLPQKDLIGASIRFFHQQSGLNYHFYISDKNVLNLSPSTDALLARYQSGNSKSQLLVFRYPGEAAAGKALDSFVKTVIPDARNSAAQLPGGKWVAAKSWGPIVVIAYDDPDEDAAVQLVDLVLSKARMAKP